MDVGETKANAKKKKKKTTIFTWSISCFHHWMLFLLLSLLFPLVVCSIYRDDVLMASRSLSFKASSHGKMDFRLVLALITSLNYRTRQRSGPNRCFFFDRCTEQAIDFSEVMIVSPLPTRMTSNERKARVRANETLINHRGETELRTSVFLINVVRVDLILCLVSARAARINKLDISFFQIRISDRTCQ